MAIYAENKKVTSLILTRTMSSVRLGREKTSNESDVDPLMFLMTNSQIAHVSF